MFGVRTKVWIVVSLALKFRSQLSSYAVPRP